MVPSWAPDYEQCRRRLVIVLDHRNFPLAIGLAPTRQSIESGGIPTQRKVREWRALESHPSPGAEVCSAPGQGHLVALTAIDVENLTVMNDASSDATKTIALASFSRRPRRPRGTVVTRAALSSGVPVKRVNMPVQWDQAPRHSPGFRLADLERHGLCDAFYGVLAADID
jgi:hypothetical protein